MGLFNRSKNKQDNTRSKPQPGERVVTFEGLGMHCGGCQSTVEVALLEVPGTRHIDVDLKGQSATVIYDPDTTDVATLRHAIAEVGFPPRAETASGG